MEIELQRADETDLEQLLPLVTAYHRFEEVNRSEEQRRTALQFLLGEQDFGAVWRIESEKQLAGYIAICKGYSIEFGGFDAFVDELYLEPEYRGRGIGKTVLRQIGAEARALGINALHLEVARDNDKARRLYRSSGFEARDKYLLMTLELAE